MLEGSDNLVGTNGDGNGDGYERNIISGETGANPGLDAGVFVASGSGNVIAGNYIGTDKSGTLPLGNGVGVSSGRFRYARRRRQPGRRRSRRRNVISGNGSGIDLFEGSNDVIAGNYIGTDYTGTKPLPNVNGIIFERVKPR